MKFSSTKASICTQSYWKPNTPDFSKVNKIEHMAALKGKEIKMLHTYIYTFFFCMLPQEHVEKVWWDKAPLKFSVPTLRNIVSSLVNSERFVFQLFQ